jgi:hypothetical protein
VIAAFNRNWRLVCNVRVLSLFTQRFSSTHGAKLRVALHSNVELLVQCKANENIRPMFAPCLRDLTDKATITTSATFEE